MYNVSSAAAVVAVMEKKRRDSVFTKEEEIFIIKQFEPEEWLQSFKIRNEFHFVTLFFYDELSLFLLMRQRAA